VKFNLPTNPVKFTYDPAGVQSLVHIGHQPNADNSRALLVACADLQACTIGIWMDGQYSVFVKETYAYPLRIEWRLYLGVGCQVDEDYYSGVTILKDQNDFATREGLLFQVDCRVARSMWLTGRIVDAYDKLQLNLPLRTIFWPLSGRPECIIGTAIG
jgi:hypothetical protein